MLHFTTHTSYDACIALLCKIYTKCFTIFTSVIAAIVGITVAEMSVCLPHSGVVSKQKS